MESLWNTNNHDTTNNLILRYLSHWDRPTKIWRIDRGVWSNWWPWWHVWTLNSEFEVSNNVPTFWGETREQWSNNIDGNYVDADCLMGTLIVKFVIRTPPWLCLGYIASYIHVGSDGSVPSVIGHPTIDVCLWFDWRQQATGTTGFCYKISIDQPLPVHQVCAQKKFLCADSGSRFFSRQCSFWVIYGFCLDRCFKSTFLCLAGAVRSCHSQSLPK